MEEIPKGLIPGEWAELLDEKTQKKYVCYTNAYADVANKIKVISPWQSSFDQFQNESELAAFVLKDLIQKAIAKREIYEGYASGCRLVYGINDALPGLIVDQYQKVILIQINTAGVDRFRELIKKEFETARPSHVIHFFDHPEYRKAEVLPLYEKDNLEDDLEILENGLCYKIPKKIVQKIGYYFDHRENRAKLLSLLQRLNVKKERGLDLFSYVGSWGLHLLKAGVEKVVFVDQGDMGQAVINNLELNHFGERGEFLRQDVFKYLDEAFSKGEKFDVIVSDPPAFTKSEKNKSQALLGYEKLHLKALRLIAEQGIFVAASCTHYVPFEELDKTVQDAALKTGQKLQLLDLGVQGFDHPMHGFNDKSFYIKYLVYFVSRG